MKQKTIWEALAEKLGRQPTNAEANAECRRIIREGSENALIERAGKGKLPWQKK